MLGRMENASAFVKSAPAAKVIEAVQDGQRARDALARANRTKKELAIATAGMGAEVVGSLAGGAVVGYMQAHDYEEWIALGAVAIGAISGMKRLDEPSNPYYQAAFATANGMGAALAAGYARDYFSGAGGPKPLT